MFDRRRRWLLLLTFTLALLVCLSPLSAKNGAAPPITLARIYHRSIDLSHYWVSEKLDGIRAYWDGKRMISRSGHPFMLPDGFTAGFPDTPLDGELWCGRGCFQRLSRIVLDKKPDPRAWDEVRYMVFDLPTSPAPFSVRLLHLNKLFENVDNPHIRLIPQYRVDGHEALMRRLAEITADGGEGLMLRHDDAPYRPGRSSDLLKVKPFEDAEARVIAHLPGKGKYRGMLGSLMVETPEGLRFRIGSGFTDPQRRSPPPIGAIITYRYNGKTEKGIPRFARFLRVRQTF
ncbi:MAG TPA: DNA ligase [Chromatiales bacterium]|nr:DNA ligase [Chromatiales bacterium]